ASRDAVVGALESATVGVGAGVARGRIDASRILPALATPPGKPSSVSAAGIQLPTVLLAPVGIARSGRLTGAQLGRPRGGLSPGVEALGFSIADQDSQPLVAAINQ